MPALWRLGACHRSRSRWWSRTWWQVGWATIVGGSISYSLLTPSKSHLLFSQRLIHARLYAQWCVRMRVAGPRAHLLLCLAAFACGRLTVGALVAAGVGEAMRDRLETSARIPDLGLPSARGSDDRTQIGIPKVMAEERFDRL